MRLIRHWLILVLALLGALGVVLLWPGHTNASLSMGQAAGPIDIQRDIQIDIQRDEPALTSDPAIGSPVFSTTFGTPVQPLLAWTLADDGSLFVLDATHSLFQLAPHTLAPVAKSPPLLPALGSGRSSLAVDKTHIFVSGDAFTQTLVLTRTTFEPVATLVKSSKMIVEPGKRLFMLVDEKILSGDWLRKGLWAYDLNDLTQAPDHIIQPTMASAPVDLVLAPEAGQLYVQTYHTPGTSPRNSVSVRIFSTDTLTPTGSMYDDRHGFAFLSRPAIAERRDRAFAITQYSAPFTPGKLLIFDGQGTLLADTEAFAGVPVTDVDGNWLYLLQERGLWVLRGDDLADIAIQAILPFTTKPPTDLLLSPDGQTLYLLGNGWLTAFPSATLHALGIPPIVSIPSAWRDVPDYERPVFYPPINVSAPVIQTNQADQAPSLRFATIGLEAYRSDDGGITWQLLPVFTYPDYIEVYGFSPSPDYAQDNTFVVRSWPNEALYRSTDRGNSLTAGWIPRLAFTSDRDGNREIYTMDPAGDNVQRITNHPASDEVPAWSPAWTRIAFQSNRNGNWDIFSIRAGCDPRQAITADESTQCDLRRLTDDPGDDVLPAWSPDGHLIAFVSTRDGNPEIYVMDAAGQNKHRLTFYNGGDWRPAWAPNGKELIFTSDRSGNNDLYLMRLPDLKRMSPSVRPQVTALTTNLADDRDPTISTGGSLLFLSDRDGIMRTYDLTLKYRGSPRPYVTTDQAETHPSGGVFGAGLVVAREEKGLSNIFKVENGIYIPLTETQFFDGHPASAPVWWEPDFKIVLGDQ